MSLRISSLVLATALVAACAQESSAPEGATVECAIGEGADFAKVCTLERASHDSSTFLIHGPDGSFRRVLIDPETGEFGAEDGADALKIVSQDDKLAEFSIAGDRYRIPHRLVRRTGQ